MANNAVAEVFTFPTEVAEFDGDERISFSRLDSKYIAVQDDGTEFEFDATLKRWIPLADNDAEDPAAFAAAQQRAGGAFQQDAAAGRDQSRKRKTDHASHNDEPHDHNGRRGENSGNSGNDVGSSSKRAKAANKQAAPRQPKQNTAVYVTGLPADATADEVAELFSRKCGVIAEEIDSGRPRIKMYTDGDGRFKGDALIVFFKPQSVEMAIMLLDDTEFRFAAPGASAGAGRMRVQAADASYKKTNYQSESATPGGDSGTPSAEGGGPANAPAAPGRSGGKGAGGGKGGGGAHQDKQKIIKKTQKLDAKLADWSSDEDERFFGSTGGPSGGGGGGGGSRSAKWDKVVVLKHMFTLAELDEDPAALLDIKEDIREECGKLGDVTNVVLFDEEEAGIVSVKFKTAEAAAACVRMMGGRAFDGRTVEATLATGREKYKKSKKGGEDDGAGGSSSDDEEDDN